MFYNFILLKNCCKTKNTNFFRVCVQIIGEPPAMICRKNRHLGGEKLIAMPWKKKAHTKSECKHFLWGHTFGSIFAKIKMQWVTLPKTNIGPEKMDGWKMILSFWGIKRPIFRARFAVSFREGTVIFHHQADSPIQRPQRLAIPFLPLLGKAIPGLVSS